LPADWHSYSPQQLRKMDEGNDQSQPIACDVLFAPAIQADRLELPYMIVQSRPANLRDQPVSSVKKELISEAAGAADRSRAALRGLDVQVTVDEPQIDLRRMRILSRSHMALSGGRMVEGLSVCLPGADAIVLVHAYADVDSYELSRPVFEWIIDSFQYDVGFEYQPVRTDQWRQAERVAVTIGVIIGVTIVMVLVQFRRRGSRHG